MKEKKEKSFEKKWEDKYGKKSIFRPNEKKSYKYDLKNFISTGSRCINDMLTGDRRCGIPIGHITEMYGPEGVGKSTLALHIAAEATMNKIKVGYVDAEHAMEEKYALDIGVDPKYFYLIQPNCGEQAFDMIQDLVKAGFGLLVGDSVDAFVPRRIIEGDMEAQHMGVHARLMGKGIRKLLGKIKRSNTAVLFINQLRMNIGNYGNPETTTGGKALKFYAFIRMDVRAPRGGKIEIEEKEKKVEKGILIKLKTVKNKVYLPFRRCEVNLFYGKGIDRNDDLIRYLDSKGIIKMLTKKDGKRGLFIKYPVTSKKKMKKRIFLKKLEDAKYLDNIKLKLKACEEVEEVVK